MIAKTIRGTGFKGALDYIMNDKDSHQDRATLLMTNTGGTDATSIAQEMRAIAEVGNIGKPVNHIILSHNKDNLNDEQWCELATKYMDKMGYKDHQFALIRHNDTDNDHVHLVINAVNMETGKGFNTSNEKYKSLNAMKEITQEMNLTPNPKKAIGKHKAHDNDNIRAIQDAIDTVLSTNKGKGITPDDFEKSLKELGITAKRAENVNGIQGYSFKIDGSSEAFTGKRLGSGYKLSGLEDRGLLTLKVVEKAKKQQEMSGLAKQISNFIPTLPLFPVPSSIIKSPQITVSTAPTIGEVDKFADEQQKRVLKSESEALDFDAMQRQWVADKVRKNAERRAMQQNQL